MACRCRRSAARSTSAASKREVRQQQAADPCKNDVGGRRAAECATRQTCHASRFQFHRSLSSSRGTSRTPQGPMRLRTRILPAALAAATLLAGCQPTPPASATGDASTRPYGRIAFRPCVLTSEQGLPPVEAQCASFPVAENPAQPDGRRIALNIAWLPADNKGGGTPDPVF